MTDRKFPTGIYPLPSGSVRAVVSAHGDKVFETFATIGEAIAWREAGMAAVERGEPIPDPVRDRAKHQHRYTKYADVAPEWLEHHSRTASRPLTPRTILTHDQALRNHHLPWFGDMRLNEIGVADVEAFRDSLVAKNIGIEWQKKLLWINRSVLEYSRNRGWIDVNPAADVRAIMPRSSGGRRGEIPFITLLQTVAIARIIKSDYRVALWLQRLCGLRISEIYGLHIVDWNPELRVLKVQRQGGRIFSAWDSDGRPVWAQEVDRTKTEAGVRLIGVPTPLANLLNDHIATVRTGARPWEPLIVGPQGGRNSTSYGNALVKAAAALGIVDQLGNAATTHSLRKAFAAQLDLVETRYRLMSYLMGHKGGQAIEGAAPITHGVYNRRTPLLAEIIRAADAIGACLQEDGIQSLNTSEGDTPEGDWIPLVEACDLLDVCERTIREYAKAGKLVLTVHRAPGVKFQSTFVRPDTVRALAEERANRVSVKEAADLLNVDEGTVVRAAARLQISLVHGVDGHDRAWFRLLDYDALAQAVGSSRSFTDRHMPASRAAKLLNVKNDTVNKLIARGALESVNAPALVIGAGLGRAVWVRKEDVATLATTKKQWLGQRQAASLTPPGTMTPTQAATLLGVSPGTVRKMFRMGVLSGEEEATRGRSRIWIHATSVESFKASRQGGEPAQPDVPGFAQPASKRVEEILRLRAS